MFALAHPNLPQAGTTIHNWLHTLHTWLLSANFEHPQLGLIPVAFLFLLYAPLPRRQLRYPSAPIGAVGFAISGLLGLLGLSIALAWRARHESQRFIAFFAPWVVFGMAEVWGRPLVQGDWRAMATSACSLALIAGLVLYRITRPVLDPVRFATSQQREEVLTTYNHLCAGCGANGRLPGVQLQIDHIIPWSKGGASAVANFQPLCATCNGSSRKGDKSQDEFARILRRQGITPLNLRQGCYYKYAKHPKQSEQEAIAA